VVASWEHTLSGGPYEHGQFQILFADTSAELAPSNVPVMARSLDSAAGTLGVTPPLAFTTAAAVQGMSTEEPAAALQGKASPGTASGVGANQQAAGASMSNFNTQMITQQTESEMTQESVQFSDYMNSTYGDGNNLWQPTFYGG
jgi:hypothetical protein